MIWSFLFQQLCMSVYNCVCLRVCAYMQQHRSMPSHFPQAPPQTATTSYVCTDSTGQERCSASHIEHVNDHTHTSSHGLMHRNTEKHAVKNSFIHKCEQKFIVGRCESWSL